MNAKESPNADEHMFLGFSIYSDYMLRPKGFKKTSRTANSIAMQIDERSRNLFYMTSPQIQEYLKKNDIVVIPLGSHEQHGPHLPMGTDSIQGWLITCRAAELADVLHTHVIWMGYSPQHLVRPGTITLRANTLTSLYYDVARSLIHCGFNKLIFYLAHASNVKVIDPVLRQLRYETGAFIAIFRPDMEYTLPITKDIWEGPPEETPGWHSGEQETSQVMALDPKLVKMDKAVKTQGHAPSFLPDRFTKDSADPWATFDGKYKCLYIPLDHNEVTETGILGNPLRATAEKGNKSVELQARVFADILTELKKVKVQVRNREWVNRT